MAKSVKFRSIASKFSIFTAALVFWVVTVILAYDLRQDTFDVTKGVLLCVVVLLVAGSISRMTIRLLARPLSLLQEGLTSVRQGKLEPIQVSKTGDEVEFLGESFNAMIEALAQTRSELLQNQELLEDRIRQRTEQLQIAMQKALTANQVKSDFLANISHELRTPMNGILGMIGIVLNTPLNAEQRDHLETAESCAYSLLALLNDLLDISKIEAGRMVLEKIPFSYRELIEAAAKAHSAIGQQKGLKIHKEIASDVPDRIVGDPLRIRQIVNNLMSNAVKFTQQGSVTLRTYVIPRTDKNKLAIGLEVIDTGMGIPADKLGHIFEKFTQADSSISRRYGGSGLGLAITRFLVEMHGGTVTVKSELGIGSTFTATMECDRAPELTSVPVETKPIQINGGCILLVEDNMVNQKMVASILQKRGYSVEVTSNGQEALEALERRPFHLVLMDVQMPVMDGLEATRLIRRDKRFTALPIVAMTAHAMEGDREGCLAAGMNGYISKPVYSDHLLSVVEEFAQEPRV